ncbi:MAG: glycerophosphoryl diester phosphodiesterase [Acidimicrobiaceae bacterium]|jgi:glycerophosphoryl diester phosphodiesterase
MTLSFPSLRLPPIAFAHRGARAHARENTLEAFVLARRLGATGIESDVWCTADGIAVLDHDGVVGSRLRRRPISELPRAALPSHIPELADLYTECGTDFELSLDVKDANAAAATVAVTRDAGGDASERLWLCHHNWHQLEEWRTQFPDVRLVDSTRLRYMRNGPERRAAQLSEAGIDAVNLHESDWTGGLTTLFHRFDLLTFGWDAQFDRVLDNLLSMGIDGVYSDHVDRMMEAVARLEAR